MKREEDWILEHSYILNMEKFSFSLFLVSIVSNVYLKVKSLMRM